MSKAVKCVKPSPQTLGKTQPHELCGPSGPSMNEADWASAVGHWYRAAGAEVDNLKGKLKPGSRVELAVVKAALKVGLAAGGAAAGALAGGGLGASVGAAAAFAAADQLLDKAFPDGVPKLSEGDLLTKQKTLVSLCQAEAEQKVRALGKSDDATKKAASRLFTINNDKMKRAISDAFVNAATDAWLKALSAAQHGTGGSNKQGNQSLTDATTGRLHLDGTVVASPGLVSASVSSAELQGIQDQKTANRYANRRLDSINTFIQYEFKLWNARGAIMPKTGGKGFVIEGSSGNFEGFLGKLPAYDGVQSQPTLRGPATEGDPQKGAALVWDQLKGSKLSDLGVKTVKVTTW